MLYTPKKGMTRIETVVDKRELDAVLRWSTCGCSEQVAERFVITASQRK
jgi:hypothetical protein